MPILLGILLQSLYTSVDAIILGRFASKEALAAIESVYTLTKLPVIFFVIANIVNITLDLLFVTALNLGVVGAALANCNITVYM